MLEVPDLSHLTPEEQQKILNVIKRQQDEEEKERNMLKVLQDQFKDYKAHIKMIAEESKVHACSVEDNDPVCALCFKTKFAEGCGHVCTFCDVRFCSRCGGRITIKSNKTIWVCNLCRKHKEILTKTGAWYHGDSNHFLKDLVPNDPGGKENQNVNNADKLQKENGKRVSYSNQLLPSKPGVLKSLDKNVNENTNDKASAKMPKIETVPNFQMCDNTVTAVIQSMSMTNVNESEHFANKVQLVQQLGSAISNEKQEELESSSILKNELGNLDERHNIKKQNASLEAKLETSARATDVTGQRLQKGPNCNSCIDISTTTVIDLRKGLKNDYSDVLQSHSMNGMIRQDKQQHSNALQYAGMGSAALGTGMSSSEDDVRSTTEYSSLCDGEKETSISDFEILHAHQAGSQSCYPTGYHVRCNAYVEDLPNSSSNFCLCQRSIGKIKDCQYDTGFATLHERMPVSWQPSTDGRFLIGHLTLYKNVSSSNHMVHGSGALLGLKVVGGKTTPSGRLGAFVTKVRKGSLADTIGHLKPGDEIISWNKYCLQDATFDEVYEIILESKPDTVVELVVSRPIRDLPRIPETRLHQTAESSSCSLDSERRDFDAFPVKPSLGRIQIKLWYDAKSRQLYVTAIRAVDLSMREGGLPRNPYLKMYLLPDRSNSVKRRTKTAKKTLSPEWMQTFIYSDVRRDDLGAMALELTLWDFDRSLEANNKFMGEVIVDLGLVCLNDEPHWFHLMPLGYGMNQDYATSNFHSPLTRSVSSDANVTDNINAVSKSASYMGQKEAAHMMTQTPTKSGPKRRLPHLPLSVASSRNAIVSSETKLAALSSPSGTEPIQIETDVADSSHCSDRSMDFETMSVDRTLQTFVGGVGPGQVIGRQALAMSSVGEIELGFYQGGGKFTIHVKHAHSLSCRLGTKIMPVYYVKVYMLSGVRCIDKKKTKPSSRSLSPNFSEKLVFDCSQVGNTLQVIVWGDYGRMDNKVFTGSAQISLECLDLSTPITGRYKLFPSSTIFDASSYGPRQDSYSSFGS